MSATLFESRPARLLASDVKATLSPALVPQRFGQPSPRRPKVTSYESRAPGTPRFEADARKVMPFSLRLSFEPVRKRTYTCFVPGAGAAVASGRWYFFIPAFGR